MYVYFNKSFVGFQRHTARLLIIYNRMQDSEERSQSENNILDKTEVDLYQLTLTNTLWKAIVLSFILTLHANQRQLSCGFGSQ